MAAVVDQVLRADVQGSRQPAGAKKARSRQNKLISPFVGAALNRIIAVWLSMSGPCQELRRLPALPTTAQLVKSNCEDMSESGTSTPCKGVERLQEVWIGRQGRLGGSVIERHVGSGA